MNLFPEPTVPPPAPAIAIHCVWAAVVFGPRIRDSEAWRWTWAGLQVLCQLPGWVLLEVWDRLRRRLRH